MYLSLSLPGDAGKAVTTRVLVENDELVEVEEIRRAEVPDTRAEHAAVLAELSTGLTRIEIGVQYEPSVLNAYGLHRPTFCLRVSGWRPPRPDEVEAFASRDLSDRHKAVC